MTGFYSHNKTIYTCLALLFVISLQGCIRNKENKPAKIEQVAANKDVANYMEAFQGLGALADSSQPTLPQKALAGFRYPHDLAFDLILSEPEINQPLEISFDHRGRLWVVQYKQYPYPEGLKVTSVDNWNRVVFDKVPQAPPHGVKGEDKITIFEDTRGDGKYDKATDAITGLNIATSVTLGRGNIWVMSPPYLLAYPDLTMDGIPDEDPVVHLDGFGLEDTHAVANSLRWGPDGWLYGAQGSTTTANVNSAVSKNVSFKGQAIWRYHPESHVFEVFAEGGGNTFNVEIDEKGRIFSGDNGTDRGPYFKQGAYYIKNLGKHGEYTNPYVFGVAPSMHLDGEKIRFTHALIKYDGGSLPPKYDGAMVAINPLHGYAQLSRFKSNGSTFSISDEERILETNDKWFRPVDLNTGPDGAIYFADWYDSRLTHVDPHDNWHKTSGRIYRLRNKNAKTSIPKFDLSQYTNDQLVGLLSHKNKWFRQQALQLFADRKDRSAIPKLMELLDSDNSQTALEAFWALNLSGGFDDQVAITAFNHRDPFVRMWAVRLIGDKKKVSSEVSDQLAQLASRESHPEVRSQLASSSKRLPAASAIPIIRNLLKNHHDARDPDIPLLIWWAMESKAESDRNALLLLFEDPAIWSSQTVQETILERMMQRYTLAGGDENFSSCARLLKLAPSVKHARLLINGLQEGLRGRDVTALPTELLSALQPYQSQFKEETLALALRQGEIQAVEKALVIIADEKAEIGKRLTYTRILGEVNQPKSIPALLQIVNSRGSSDALKQTALQALQRYDETEIGSQVAKAYPVALRSDPQLRDVALALFASRPVWARQLLDAIVKTKQIKKEDVSEQIVRRLKLLNDAAIVQTVDRLWPNIRPATSDEKNNRISHVSQLLKSGTGYLPPGRAIFKNRCGNCHRLFNEGGRLGPDLTGYERSNLNYLLTHIIDPNIDIREGYDYYHITTTDGRSLVGTIIGRRGGTVTLQPIIGDAITLTTKQIKDMRAQQTSLMPENLLDEMTDQQIRDLFAYLMQPVSQ